MPGKSISIFQVMLINGVLFRSIFTSLPNPEAPLSAIDFKKFPFSFEPKEYKVLLKDVVFNSIFCD